MKNTGKAFTNEELTEALRAITSVVHKCEKVRVRLSRGTSQWTLLKNRLKAFRIASSLIKQALKGWKIPKRA